MSIDYSMFKFHKGNLTKIKRKKDVTETNRNKIKKLCHYQCALCGQKGTQVHHIIPRSVDKSKIDDIDNLILLCMQCHIKVHDDMKIWKPRLQKIRKQINKNLYDKA